MWAIIVAVVAIVIVFLAFADDPTPKQSCICEESWPPISDEEFIHRCTSDTNPETALKVRKIISESLSVPYEQVYPEQKIVEDLGCE